MSFRDYLESKALLLCMAGIGGLYLALIFYLCAFPVSLLLILCFSGVFVLLVCLVSCWRRTNRRLRLLKDQLEALPEKYLIGEILERPTDAVELQYYLLMKEISRSAIGAVEQARADKQDYCDYVEQWVHEMKTPLTACALILSNGAEPAKLRRELRRADNLTESILTYAKLRTAEKDTQISLVPLRAACDQAVRGGRWSCSLPPESLFPSRGMAGGLRTRSSWYSSSSSCLSTVPNTARAAKFKWNCLKTA